MKRLTNLENQKTYHPEIVKLLAAYGQNGSQATVMKDLYIIYGWKAKNSFLTVNS